MGGSPLIGLGCLLEVRQELAQGSVETLSFQIPTRNFGQVLLNKFASQLGVRASSLPYLGSRGLVS